MFVLILIIVIFSSAFCLYGCQKFFNIYDNDFLSIILGVLGGLLIFVLLWIAVEIGICVDQLCDIPVIEQKIIVYQDENKKIEEEIHTIVENYKDYESGIFDKNASVSTIVNLYPELKSDSLVKQQIDIYQKNNEQIKKLKVSLLEAKKAKFMLYFGKI